jgi:hypothetical protein
MPSRLWIIFSRYERRYRKNAAPFR